jgi:uncharacterized OsmC-like protein
LVGDQATTEDAAGATETYAVTAESRTETHTVVEARAFTFSVDEPSEVGGTNAAPTPVEYLLGGLAGCLNVVGHQVAEEQGLTVRTIEIDLEGEIDPRKFLGEAEEPRPGYQSLSVFLSIDTDADDAELAAWLETVEERCPVSDNIANETPLSLSVDRR